MAITNIFAQLTPELGHQMAPDVPDVVTIANRGTFPLNATTARLRAILTAHPEWRPGIAQCVRAWISPTDLQAFVDGEPLTARNVAVLIEATMPGVTLTPDGRFGRR